MDKSTTLDDASLLSMDSVLLLMGFVPSSIESDLSLVELFRDRSVESCDPLPEIVAKRASTRLWTPLVRGCSL